MTAVLVVEDGTSPYVLAAVRSLSRAGFRVGVASATPNPKVVASRHTDRWHRVRLPERDLPGFTADVRDVLTSGRYGVVVGADDIELLALSAVRDELPALFPHSDHAAVVRAVDKHTLTRAAESVGLMAPRTRLATPEALAAVTGPVVVKARLHWTPATAPSGGSRHLLVAVCEDAASAAAQVAVVEASHGQAMLQEVVRGEQLAVSVVVDHDGAVLVASQQRTLVSSLSRTSARAQTVPVDEALVEQVGALLRELGWFGLANLQFLRPPGGPPYLIDLNGRFYGSLALAVAAGADLPAVWVRAALGQPAGPPTRGRPGVRFQTLHDDLVRARVERRGGLRADVGETLRFAVGAVHSTWAPGDPRPAAAFARSVIAGGLRRRLAARRSR